MTVRRNILRQEYKPWSNIDGYDYQNMVHCEDHKFLFKESIVSQVKRRINNHLYYHTDQCIQKDYLATY